MESTLYVTRATLARNTDVGITKAEGRFALAHATWRAFRRQFAYTVFPRLCLLALIFTQPFLISSILSLLDKPDNERSRSEGHGLILAMGLVMIGIAVSVNVNPSCVTCLSLADFYGT